MLRMQHCTVVSRNGTQQLVKVTSKRKNQVIASIIVDPCTGYDEATTRSYFLRAYRWAPFWRPVLQTVADAGRPINKDCTLAITYGFMGQSLGSEKLQTVAQGLYGETLRRVRSLIQLSTQVELAWLIPTILLMAMYNVSLSCQEGGALDITIFTPSDGDVNVLRWMSCVANRRLMTGSSPLKKDRATSTSRVSIRSCSIAARSASSRRRSFRSTDLAVPSM